MIFNQQQNDRSIYMDSRESQIMQNLNNNHSNMQNFRAEASKIVRILYEKRNADILSHDNDLLNNQKRIMSDRGGILSHFSSMLVKEGFDGTYGKDFIGFQEDKFVMIYEDFNKKANYKINDINIYIDLKNQEFKLTHQKKEKHIINLFILLNINIYQEQLCIGLKNLPTNIKVNVYFDNDKLLYEELQKTFANIGDLSMDFDKIYGYQLSNNHITNEYIKFINSYIEYIKKVPLRNNIKFFLRKPLIMDLTNIAHTSDTYKYVNVFNNMLCLANKTFLKKCFMFTYRYQYNKNDRLLFQLADMQIKTDQQCDIRKNVIDTIKKNYKFQSDILMQLNKNAENYHLNIEEEEFNIFIKTSMTHMYEEQKNKIRHQENTLKKNNT